MIGDDKETDTGPQFDGTPAGQRQPGAATRAGRRISIRRWTSQSVLPPNSPPSDQKRLPSTKLDLMPIPAPPQMTAARHNRCGLWKTHSRSQPVPSPREETLSAPSGVAQTQMGYRLGMRG